MRRFRIALAQVNSTVGDLEGNVAKIRAGLEQARALGCRLVAFPELAITGYPPEDLLFKSAFIEANLRALADLVKASAGLTAVVGFVDKRDDIFNAAAVLHDGALAGVYHKQYLPNYGVFDENRYFQAGTEAPVFELGETSFAVNICEDIWYPTGPTTRQALAGAELVVTINASPYHAGKGHQRERMITTRAADDLVCLAFVNMVGGQDELVFDGGSLIVNERGEPVARGRQFAEDFVVADLDLDAVFHARLHDSRRRKEKLRAGEALTRVALPALSEVADAGAGASARGAAGAGGRGLRGARAGHPRLRPQERVQARGDRAVGRHRLLAGGRHRGGGARQGERQRRHHAVAVFLVRHARRRQAAGQEPRHRLPDAAHHARLQGRSSGRWPRRSRGSRRTWPRRTSRPVSAARCSWR